MTILLLGLIGFIGVHLTRVFAEDWRTQTRARFGEQRYKMIYSVISVVSFVMIVWGYGAVRQESSVLWAAPLIMYHIAASLMLISMVLLAAFHSKHSHIKVRLHHPMLWSVVVFSAAHLLINGRTVDLLLFGSFLVWSVLNLISCYARDKRYQIKYPEPQMKATIINIVVGILIYVVFAGFLHKLLIGVSPVPGV